MRGARIINIFIKYFLIFIGLTIFLFLAYKFVPENILKNDLPDNIPLNGSHPSTPEKTGIQHLLESP